MKVDEKLGRYKIISKIGAGGMGEVFLARDEQLDRNIALKVLLPEFRQDEQRVKRFRFEAKAVSALNHPGIITIHEIADEGEHLYIATEFVDGVTLREKMDAGRIKLVDALRIGEQIADALAAAHEANIVHRDIKPENIMIRPDGYTKILDFGLAKPTLFENAGGEEATIQMVKTQPGLVMGSVRYMSPEQARGKPTGTSSDIWSLGVVLCEMITGKNPFAGETISDSLAALIHKEPEIDSGIPEAVKKIIKKALNKNSDGRYSSIRVMAQELKDFRLATERDSASISSELVHTSVLPVQGAGDNKTLIHKTFTSENTSAIPIGSGNLTQVNTIAHQNRFGFGVLPVLAVALLSTLAVGAWYFLPAFANRSMEAFSSISVSRLTSNGSSLFATVSPDGTLVAYIDNKARKQKLLVRQVATGSIIEIVPETELQFYQPTFSPDGQFIYYVMADNGLGTLFRSPVIGGGERLKIATDVDNPVAFSPDGKRAVFLRQDPKDGGTTAFAVDKEGGELETVLTTKDIGFDRFNDLVWIEANKLLVAGWRNGGQAARKASFVVANIETNTVEERDVFEKFNSNTWNINGGVEWLKDKSAIIFAGSRSANETNQIWRLSLDDGELRSITTDTSAYVSVSVSDDIKTLVAGKVDRITGLQVYSVKTDQTTQVVPESREFSAFASFHEMPDGRIVFAKLTGNEINLFSINRDGTEERQLTRGSKFNFPGSSTPDGKFLVFASNRNGRTGIWRSNIDGSNSILLSSVENGRDISPRVTQDGNTVLFHRQRDDGGKTEIMRVSIDGGESVSIMPNSETSNFNFEISPDGKSLGFMAMYYDKETSEFSSTVNIVPLEDGEVTGDVKKLDYDVNRNFEWSPDGKSVDFISRSGIGNIVRLSIDDLKEAPITAFTTGNLTGFAWMKDGENLLISSGRVERDLVLIKQNSEE